MTRTAKAQLLTARMILAQFITQIEEFEGMNREQRLTERGRDLTARIDGLRAGRSTWADRVTELEAELTPEPETETP